MELVQSRIVTDDVEALARFYAALVARPVTLNEYYVEVPAGPVTVGFSRCRFTEDRGGSCSASAGAPGAAPGEVILDFLVGGDTSVDAEQGRIDALGVDWVLPPTDQPWGTRSMLFRDPQGHLVNVFAPFGAHGGSR